MSVPDYKWLLEQLFNSSTHHLTTKDGAGRFTEAAVDALHARDANFGHLRKPEGRTHVVGPDGNRHAVDVVLYKATGQIVDIIRDAGEPGADLSWGVGPEGEYGPGDWYVTASGGNPENPPPNPPPAPVIECKAQPVDLGPVLAELAALRADVAELKNRPAPTIPAPVVKFPVYRGSLGRLFGSVTLTPEP